MKRILPFQCLLLAIFLCSQGFSQTQQFNFRAISVDKGLSQSTVYAITQDTLGFMWMATQDGLNRYNGEYFSVYHPDDKNPLSLRSNYIRSLFLDKAGQLWIGGDKGVSRYNISGDNFHNYNHVRKAGEWYISSITQDAQNVIWAATNAGELLQLNQEKNEFQPFSFAPANAGIKSITSLCYFQRSIYLGTNAGIFKLVNGSNRLERVNLGIDGLLINEMFIDEGKLWIATEGTGVFCMDIKTTSVKHYTSMSGTENSLPDNDVRCVNKDARGNIWVGTFRGLSILDPNTDRFENYTHQPAIPYTISQNSVRCLYHDKQNGMWLGTFYGGLNYYHANDIKFNLLNQNSGKFSLNDQVVNVIKQDEQGNFWIGTNDKGLNLWNRKTNTIEYYTHNETGRSEISSNNIKSIVFHNGKVLVGTHNMGLNILDPVHRQLTVFRHDENDAASISGDMVYALLKDRQSRIWVGTRTGLDLWDGASNSFRHILSDSTGKRLSSNEITFLFEDSRARIWVGTTFGVNQIQADKNAFSVFPGSTLSNEVVNCIAEDKQHRIWVGTRNGLNLFDENRQSFISFSDRPEFLKGTIYGIVPDEENNLWISTNRGLACLNPDTKNLQWYDGKDGLQSNQFNLYAFCKANDGMLLFGGINGISYFYPSTIRQQQIRLEVSFTGLEVLNKSINPEDGSGILELHIDKTNSLELAHDQKQFTVVFNTFNYISAGRTKYQYKLDGFDADWQQAENTPKASYRNVPAGSYTLRVKAIGPNGETSPVRSLGITILPPWYRTTLFYLLVFVLLCCGGYIAYRIVFERKRTLQQLKTERTERDRLNYFNQVKTDFFTNVSHELRTPLTLILAPLEELIRKPNNDKQLSRQYKGMFQNARRLYNLVNQLFEFRKTETGTRKLNVSRGDLANFVNEIFNSFQPLAETNAVRFTFENAGNALNFLFDKDAVEKILFNLLSNAFKYTPAGGMIRIDLTAEASNAMIRITDSGKGIETEHLDKIFDRYYQVNNAEMNLGSGVGLAFTKRLVELHHGQISVQSRFGEGSSFTVMIPMADEVYENDAQSEAYETAVFPGNVDMPGNAPSPEDFADDSKNSGEKITAPVDREKLLIVDDNRDIVVYLSTYFGRVYNIQTAFDGQQALTVLETEPVDLVICDVMMPEMDGLHFCKRVKKNIQTSHIPVILLTAKTETDQQIKGLEMGADDYMTKPFSINLLEAKVQSVLRSRRQLKEYYSGSKEVVPEKMAFNSIDEEFLRRAIGIVEENIAEPDFSVDKFSREIGMSRSNLYLKMKAITGESVTDFIKRIRFKKAVELLQERRHTIAEIAYMSGFNSPSYFSTAFKQFYNCMPTEYLAKNAE